MNKIHFQLLSLQSMFCFSDTFTSVLKSMHKSHVSLCLFLFFQRRNDTVVDGYLLFKISQERNCN